jgi:hypothetical protein
MRPCTVALVAVVALCAAGCDDTQSNPAGSGTTLSSGTASAPRKGAVPACTPMEPGRNRSLLYCWSPERSGDGGSFSFRGRRIPIAYPNELPAGHWEGGFHYGKTLLLQWRAECEVPYAFFVPWRGGTPRLVTGERSMRRAPPSLAHGWTRDGEAIVEVLPGCSEFGDSEFWLISPHGKKRELGAVPD